MADGQNGLSTLRRSHSQGGWTHALSSGSTHPLRATVPSPSQGSHGVTGFIGNLAGDVRDAAMGIPTGIVSTFLHPIHSIDVMAKSTWKDWSPLFHGDVNKFASNVYDHPLAPLLDVASAFTLGGAAVGKTASLLGKEGAIAYRGSHRLLGGASPVKLEKHYHANPAIRLRQHATERLTDSVASLAPKWFGGAQNVSQGLTGGHAADYFRHTRKLARNEETRSAAARAMHDLQIAAIVKMGEDLTHTPDQAAALVVNHAATMMDTHAYRLSPNELLGPPTTDFKNQMKIHGNRISRYNNRIEDTKAKLRVAKNTYYKLDLPGGVKLPKRSNVGEHVSKVSNAKADFYRKEMGKAAPDVQRYAETKARFERIMYKDEYQIPDFQHYGIRIGRSTDMQSARLKLRDKVYNDFIKSADARDKYAAADYAHGEYSIAAHEGQRAAARARVADAAEAVRTKAELRNKALLNVKHAQDRLDKLTGMREQSWNKLIDLQPINLPEGFVFRKKFNGVPAVPEDFSKQPWDEFVGKLPSELTTRVPSQAARDAEGNYLLLHDHTMKMWNEELKRSSKFAKVLYNYPLQAWKWMVLASVPRYFVNNAVGNTFMYMMSTGGAGSVRGLVDAYRQIKGEGAAQKMMEGVSKEVAALNTYDWQTKWYLGLHQGFSHEALQQLTDGKGRSAKAIKLGAAGLYPLTHKWTDVFLRRASINVLIKQRPEYAKAFADLRKEGIDARSAHDMAADRASASPVVRDWVQQGVNDVLGDYHHLNGLEKNIRKIVPFYSWDRAIARHGVRLSLDKPVRTLALTQAGAYGHTVNQEIFGKHMPHFLQGILPLRLFGVGGKNNPLTRRLGLQTTGLNPYSTVPGVVDALRATVGLGGNPSEDVGSQINPLVTGAYQALSGKSLLTGATMPHHRGGVIGNIALGTLESVPAARLMSAAMQGHNAPKVSASGAVKSPTLYRGDLTEQLGSFTGVFPVKKVSPTKAADLYRREQGTKLGSDFNASTNTLHKLRKSAWEHKKKGGRKRGIDRLSLDTTPKRILPHIS